MTRLTVIPLVAAGVWACAASQAAPALPGPADEATAAFGLIPLVQDTSILSGFRLIQLRSFEPSRALELVRRADGVWLRITELTGPRGAVAAATVRRVPDILWNRVATAVAAADPCLIPEPDPKLGFDGIEWWIEFKSDSCSGRRHRWEPFSPPVDSGAVRFSQVASAIEWAERLSWY